MGKQDMSDRERAIELALRYGGNDGEHHKAWVIDQMVRILAGDDYDKIILEACKDEDGSIVYSWYVGVAP